MTPSRPAEGDRPKLRLAVGPDDRDEPGSGGFTDRFGANQPTAAARPGRQASDATRFGMASDLQWLVATGCLQVARFEKCGRIRLRLRGPAPQTRKDRMNCRTESGHWALCFCARSAGFRGIGTAAVASGDRAATRNSGDLQCGCGRVTGHDPTTGETGREERKAS